MEKSHRPFSNACAPKNCFFFGGGAKIPLPLGDPNSITVVAVTIVILLNHSHKNLIKVWIVMITAMVLIMAIILTMSYFTMFQTAGYILLTPLGTVVSRAAVPCCLLERLATLRQYAAFLWHWKSLQEGSGTGDLQSEVSIWQIRYLLQPQQYLNACDGVSRSAEGKCPESVFNSNKRAIQ
jgi:hypothetical protein